MEGSPGRDVSAGVSAPRVEDITEALWGTRVSPSTVSQLNQKIYAKIKTWCNRLKQCTRVRSSDPPHAISLESS